MSNSIEDPQDARGEARSSLYLAAALYCDGSASPVKIRNLSPAGALLEGASLPGNGSLVQLVRGALIVHGLVAWCSAGRCGLKFSGIVDVQCWRANPAHSEQQRVDEVVRLLKAGAVPLPVPPLAPPDETAGVAEGADDLRRARQLLDQLGEALGVDSDVVRRHGLVLQNLDLAMQMIDAVAAGLASETGEFVPTGSRKSADQALKRGA